jgi:hypothetical protein
MINAELWPNTTFHKQYLPIVRKVACNAYMWKTCNRLFSEVASLQPFFNYVTYSLGLRTFTDIYLVPRCFIVDFVGLTCTGNVINGQFRLKEAATLLVIAAGSVSLLVKILNSKRCA